MRSDLQLAAAGGTNLAAASKALGDSSALYTTLVAYDSFGACDAELANVGRPSARAAQVVHTLAAACTRLVRASALFHRAVVDNAPALLVRATRLGAATAPLLSRASLELAALGVRA